MKPVRTAFAVIALALAAGAAHADEWTGPDKTLHFAAGAAISGSVFAVTGKKRDAFLAGVAVGAAKELFDMADHRHHTPSGKDFAVTAAGALVGAYVPGLIVGPGFIGYHRSF